MKDLILKIKNSEFLSPAEVLRLKVSLVMFFLLVFGVLTIPVSFFEDFAIGIRILVPALFFFLFLVTFLFLFFDKPRLAMHFSIYTFIGLTVYYIDGAGQFYGYFLLFITLTIIIFYQDISTYIIYGGALTTYGLYFIQSRTEMYFGTDAAYPELTPLIYQFILAGFFLVFLLYFILSDSINEKLNEEYLKSEKMIERCRSLAIKQSEDIEYSHKTRPYYMDVKFETTVKNISTFIIEKLEQYDSDRPLKAEYDLNEVVDFYFFLHNRDVNRIIDAEEGPSPAKIYARQFSKFLLDKNAEMNTVIFDFLSCFVKPSNNEFKRFRRHIDELFSSKTNRILALCFLYKFLRTEVTQLDKWGRLDVTMTHEEVKQLFQSKQFRQFISFEGMNFFLQNERLFRKHLG